MFDLINAPEVLTDLRQRHFDLVEKIRWPYYRGCRLKVLVVADNFLYFNDENFGLSELVGSLKGMSSLSYPVTVDTAHRQNPGTARLNGATSNFTFTDDSLKKYHQVWLFAADRRTASPISDAERQALRRFMDEGGGVFATGDHEDLGVTVGGYIPRVRSMRKWFWPSGGPQGEPVAPHGANATRHDTNRQGHDAGFSFNDQSDDVPQTISPRFFGSGFVRTAHPVLCTPGGVIRVLPDHPHEGECVVPGNLGGNYAIGGDSFREYPDGPDGNPLAPVLVAHATMIPGAAVPEFGKPPVPGGTFGVIGAWDGARAGAYGRIVVDATWHHFININLIGDRGLGAPNPAVPKSMGFLHTGAGQAQYAKVKAYFRNIANWLTPKNTRRCLIHRHLWCLVQDGWFLENVRRDDIVFTGRLAMERLTWMGPCDRLTFIDDLAIEVKPDIRGLIDPFFPTKGLRLQQSGAVNERAVQALADDLAAAYVGAVALEIMKLDLDPEKLKATVGEDEAEIKVMSDAANAGINRATEELRNRLKEQVTACKEVAAAFG